MQTDLYLEQHELEQEQAERGVAKYFKSREGRLPSLGTVESRTLAADMEALRAEIERLQECVIVGKNLNGIRVWGYPVLAVPADKLAVITLNTLYNNINNDLTRVCNEVGTMVKREREMEKIKNEAPDVYSKVRRFRKTVKGDSLRAMKRQSKLVDDKWDIKKRVWVGHALLEAVLATTNLFYIGVRQSKGKFRKSYILCIDPEALTRIESMHEDISLLHPVRMPMVVPPRDWEDRWNGGYLSNLNKEMSHTPLLPSSMYHKHPHNTAEDFGDHIEAVNILQQTPWEINRFVYDVASHVFKHNLEYGELLRKDPIPFPPFPEDAHTNPESKKSWKTIARNIYKQNELHMSGRTAALTAFDQARRYQRYDQFWFVWHLDWRGRMYPRGGSLTPQSSDVYRSMLRFRNGKELGGRGLYWLTIHMANCLGYDKLAYPERFKAVLKRAEEIRAWAKDPLENKSWSDADAPYAALAAAQEWAAASLMSDPTKFISHLPINMDGTTNGLQHLSALGRDLVGATATNLVPTDKPNDIYQQVANAANIIIEQDYQAWLEAGAPTVASIREETCPVMIARMRKLNGSACWRGRVDRKVVKRGVMTTPYGVTRQGVRNQMISDGFLDFAIEDPTMDVNIVADYMRDVAWQATQQVVVNARFIMDWLQSVAVIGVEEDKCLQWRNPAGMLISQEYLMPLFRSVQTATRDYRIAVEGGERKMMARKQKNAIAPNFIHALDAAHMTTVIRRLRDERITDLAMIHDSYGVHACNVDTMQRIIRQSFVDIHEANPLQAFVESVSGMLDTPLPPLPALGEYNIRDMLNAEYAFC